MKLTCRINFDYSAIKFDRVCGTVFQIQSRDRPAPKGQRQDGIYESNNFPPLRAFDLWRFDFV
jgi:hypothetical protein